MAGYPVNMAQHAEPRDKRDAALRLAFIALRKIGWHAPDVAAPVLARKAETDILTLVPEARDWQ